MAQNPNTPYNRFAVNRTLSEVSQGKNVFVTHILARMIAKDQRFDKYRHRIISPKQCEIFSREFKMLVIDEAFPAA
jgi:hypothetical protein